MEFLNGFSESLMYANRAGRRVPEGTYVPLALQVLDLLRTPDEHPEGVLVGAGICLCWLAQHMPPVGKALWEARFLDVYTATLQRYSPMERVQRTQPVCSGMICALNTVVQAAQLAGVDVVQPMLDAGGIDHAISTVTAYHMLGNPEQASICSLTYGALFILDVLLGSAQAKLVAEKIKSAGVESFRYLLDHPRSNLDDIGLETGFQATKIAALVWGRDDDGVKFRFKQEEVDKIVLAADHRGTFAECWAMREDHGHAILALCVSDLNKQLLLNSEGFIPLLVDSMFLDLEHPRRDDSPLVTAKTDFDAVAPPVQRVSCKPLLVRMCPSSTADRLTP